jgi:2-oxoglutarate dehydrogenase E2 component (dihydrolipoamide succinyltransferase)
VLTKPALDLMRERAVSPDAVAALGRPVVRRADIEALLAGGGDGDRRETTEVLSARQRAVARTVARSHATIPDAFVVMKVSATAMLRRQADISSTRKAFVGVPEQVVRAVGRLHATFPRFYCAVADDLSLTPAERADVGVTVDVGTGLLVPVVRDVASLDVVEIAQRLMSLRTRAMRGRINEADLAGSAVTLALHMDPGVILARPVIFPGQVCTLSLAALQHELISSGDGAVVDHPFVTVGMSYDHRVVNGRDACRYLTALREELEA